MDLRLHALIIGGLWFVAFNFIVGLIMGLVGIASPRDKPMPPRLLPACEWQSVCLVIPQCGEWSGLSQEPLKLRHFTNISEH